MVEDKRDNDELAFDYDIVEGIPWTQLFTMNTIHAMTSTFKDQSILLFIISLHSTFTNVIHLCSLSLYSTSSMSSILSI